VIELIHKGTGKTYDDFDDDEWETQMGIHRKDLNIESTITEVEKYGPKAFVECDCCKYFDFKMLKQWYGGYNHPIYYAINKGKEEALVFMSPEEYLKICADNAGIPYEKYTTPGPGSAVSD